MSDIPEWARKRAYERAEQYGHVGVPCGAIDAFAAYIAAHEEPPVDPLLIEARKIAKNARLAALSGPPPKYGYAHDSVANKIGDGQWDDHNLVIASLAALKRGMELAREEKP